MAAPVDIDLLRDLAARLSKRLEEMPKQEEPSNAELALYNELTNVAIALSRIYRKAKPKTGKGSKREQTEESISALLR